LTAFLISTGLIFAAELGDKSQLVALWFATRYRWWIVLTGVTIATLVVHLGSVVIGRAFGNLLPEDLVLVLVALSFFFFAAWSLRGDTFEGETERLRGGRLGALGVVTATFFFAELGDKTQLATVSLASGQDESVAVWLGSTLGMVLADALAIAVGVVAGKRLPQRALSYVSAALFVAFGIAALVSVFA
jgi:putative Ca2+/H+ antiporter (TMEM165/GDT1 family)